MKLDRGGVFRLPEETSAEEILHEAEAQGLVLHQMDGTRIRTKAEFLVALADAFGFPGYFGHNWDAVAECLADLESEGPGWALHYRGSSEFENGQPEEFATAVAILEEAAEQQASDGRVLAVLLA